MDQQRRQVLRQTALLTFASIAGSVVITAAITYVAHGAVDQGVGMLIAVLAPAILAPLGSYRHLSLGARLKDANERLRILSETDPLTGTCNRRRFLDVAERQLAVARRHGYPSSVLLMDFDRFKLINDERGHLAGDQVLVEASDVIRKALRESDTLARFGGEEFIVLLPHTARDGALMTAQRILEAIRGHAFVHEGREMPVSLSIGGVTCETSETSLDRMTSRADRLLYAAKEAGRDRYMVEGLPGQTPVPLREARP